LQAVQSLDEDRILRHFVNAVQSAIRTNFYQIGQDGGPKPLISIKFDSRKIDSMPLPRPLYEIFVIRREVEGVHLRFGKVARGGTAGRRPRIPHRSFGARQSQQVKNAVIVRRAKAARAIRRRRPARGDRGEGVAAYALLTSPLAITDNYACRRDPPLTWCGMTRYPYLVVAAASTAPSPIPRMRSRRDGFWLATLSRPAARRLRHKVMGIGARRLGSREAAFREMDIESDDAFTVAASATCRATSSATECCARKHEARRRLSIIGIFIVPIRNPEKLFGRARYSGLPRRGWRFDKAALKGAAFFSTLREGDSALARDADVLRTES